MQKQLLAAAILGLAPLLAGCLAEAGSEASIERPQWQSGYAYSFLSTGTARVMESEDGETHRETEEFDPVRRVAEVLNTTFEANDESYYLAAMTLPGRTVPQVDFEGDMGSGGMSFSEVPMAFLVGHRQRDLAGVNVGYSMTDNCTDETCSYRLDQLNFDAGPSFAWLDFPLETGKTWSTILEAEDTGGWDDDVASGLDVRVRAKVIGLETIELPVGSTRAIRVDYTFKPIGIEDWKKDVLEEAQDEGANIEAFDYSAGSLQRLWYSPDYQNVVLSESTMDVNLRVSGTDDEGERFEYAMSLGVKSRDELDGARLIPRPERGYEYIAQVLGGQIAIEDPAGSAFHPEGYTLELTSDKGQVNAAESETAAFVARLVGADALPDGHSAAWRILDAHSDLVVEGTGLAFEHAFDQPGAYAVEIETQDASGATTAADGLTLVANYDAVVPADCSPVAIPFFGQNCEAAPVPVRLGIQSLEVAALRSAALPTQFLNFGNLVLTDPLGGETSGEPNDQGEFTITIDDFSEHPVNGEDWTVEWEAASSVLENVDYRIKLLFGPETASDPAEETVEVEGTASPQPEGPPTPFDLASVIGRDGPAAARGIARSGASGPAWWLGGTGAVA